MKKFAKNALSQKRPDSIRRNVVLPRRHAYLPSPVDWRDEVLYFLLVDRFSDGGEAKRTLLDRQNIPAARADPSTGKTWEWQQWARSGSDHFQGGTIKGVRSKLAYLRNLGVTTIWLSPVFRQRNEQNTYHGYGIQDFLEVDPRFGSRKDLVDLVEAAHKKEMRIILDIIYNHSGENWVYAEKDPHRPPYRPYPGTYPFGAWLDANDQPADRIVQDDDGIWPEEFQDAACYTRAGTGSLSGDDIADPVAEHKRSDFYTLRDFNLSTAGLLTSLAECYKYWIALTDVDGFRIDTLKHVSFDEARNFCGTLKEFAANLGKNNFFIMGEIAGGDRNQSRYLEVLGRNLDSALDIGEMRIALNRVAKGLSDPREYFDGFKTESIMGSHRNIGNRHVSVLDDHDHVFGEKIRFSGNAPEEIRDHQVVAGVALQMCTLGIPCIYYGTEQAFSGPEPSERQWLPDWGSSDRYLREAMFGPAHPRKKGTDGMNPPPEGLDTDVPGFGPFGTSGYHCFDSHHPAYIRIKELAKVRQKNPVLRYGRQYLRPIRIPDGEGDRDNRSFAVRGPGHIAAWSRILNDEEAVCILNTNGRNAGSADVLVDRDLNYEGSVMTVLYNSAEAEDSYSYSGTHPAGSALEVLTSDNRAFIECRNSAPSEVIILTNHPEDDEGGVITLR
jgi:glycosidase